MRSIVILTIFNIILIVVTIATAKKLKLKYIWSHKFYLLPLLSTSLMMGYVKYLQGSYIFGWSWFYYIFNAE